MAGFGMESLGSDDPELTKNMFCLKFYKGILKLIDFNSEFVYKIFQKLPKDKI